VVIVAIYNIMVAIINILCDMIMKSYSALVSILFVRRRVVVQRFLVIIIFCTLHMGKLNTAQVETCTVYSKKYPILVSPGPCAPLQIKFFQFCYIN
jgi:hypothetical protein